jgi:2'-5' RNA ligase
VTVSPTFQAGSDPLYGLVAWPSPELDGWLRQQQERLGVRAYGEPHLNLRALFCIQHDEETLISSLRKLLGGVHGFEVCVKGWRTFPGVVFLEFERSAELDALHDRVLDLPGAPPQPYDQKDYIPHLTLALGVLPWAQPGLEAQLEGLRWPVNGFRVSALSLTREAGGEVREIHTFPLLGEEL